MRSHRILRHDLYGAICILAGMAGALSPALAAQNPDELETVIVTAQKRSERLQDIPASISAISEDELASRGVTSTVQLAQSTPGLTFGRTASWTNFYMRGIGNAFNTPAAQSPVAMYVDGVYEADAAAMALGLDNVERVEILKGPQGTLYGRNAVGGAINVITKAPGKELEFKARAAVGNLGNQEASAYVSGGSDLLQANLAVDRHVRDGYYRNVAPGGKDMDNIDDASVRAKLRFTPNERVDLTLALDYSLQKGRGPGTINLPYGPQPGAYLGFIVPTAGLFGGILPTKPWETSVGSDLSGRARDEGVSLNAHVHLDAFDLVSITAARDFDNNHGVDFDATNVPATDWRAHDNHRQVSQELQILSPDTGRFTWIGGLYFLHDNAGFDPFRLNMFANLSPQGVYIQQNTRVRGDSYAAFAEGTFKLNDALSVVVGGRYSRDELEHFLARQTITAGPLWTIPPPGTPLVQFDSSGSKHSWNKFTPKLSLNYKRPEGLYYLTASEGYNAGLYNISNIAPLASLDVPLNPTKVRAAELGAKWNLLGNRLQANLAGFYYDLKDLQTQQLAGSGLTTFENANGKIKGIDFDALWAVNAQLTLRAALESLDATYSAFHTATVYVLNQQQGNLTVPPCGGQAGATPFDAECVAAADLTGKPLMRSPKITSTLGFDWTLPVMPASRGALTLTGNWYHSDSYWTSVNGSIVSPRYDSYGANLTYVSADRQWTVALAGSNLGNAKYYLTSGEANFGQVVMLAEPRTYVLSVAYHFGP